MYIVLRNEQNNFLYLIVKDADGGEAAGRRAQEPAAEAEDGDCLVRN